MAAGVVCEIGVCEIDGFLAALVCLEGERNPIAAHVFEASQHLDRLVIEQGAIGVNQDDAFWVLLKIPCDLRVKEALGIHFWR